MVQAELWFVRHGETAWNRERRLQGWQDIALNAAGLAQARQLAARLAAASRHAPFAALYSSPLARALDTARAAADQLGLPVEVEAGLRERCFGVLEGLRYEDMAEIAPHAAAVWKRRNPDEALAGGEALGQFQARVVAAAETLARRHPGARVLAVTHGGALDILWRKTCGIALNAPHPPPLPNASINRIGITHDGRWQLLEWADVAHVKDSALDDLGV